MRDIFLEIWILWFNFFNYSLNYRRCILSLPIWSRVPFPCLFPWDEWVLLLVTVHLCWQHQLGGGEGGVEGAVQHQWACWSEKTTRLIMTRLTGQTRRNWSQLSPPSLLKVDVRADLQSTSDSCVISSGCCDPAMIRAAALLVIFVSHANSGEGPA